MSSFYSAYKISKADRVDILEVFPPKYLNIRCNHITYKYGVNYYDLPPYDTGKDKDREDCVFRVATIIGYGNNGCIEALQVAFGDIHTKPDGNPFHITLSFDKTSGVSPKDSNSLEYQYLLLPSLQIFTIPTVLPC